MEKKINYDDVPKTFLFCTHMQCPRRNKCLRYQAILCMPHKVSSYTTVNPLHVAGNEKNCPYFKPYITSRFASGMDHLLDKVVHVTAVAIRHQSQTGVRSVYR